MSRSPNMLIPDAFMAILRANGAASLAARNLGADFDPVPVVKLFNPIGAATWLVTEVDEDGDTLFGLADLGFGCPELGSFSLAELSGVRLPFGLRIERDSAFQTRFKLSVWAGWARRAGSILHAETIFSRRLPPDDELPPHSGG